MIILPSKTNSSSPSSNLDVVEFHCTTRPTSLSSRAPFNSATAVLLLNRLSQSSRIIIFPLFSFNSLNNANGVV